MDLWTKAAAHPVNWTCTPCRHDHASRPGWPPHHLAWPEPDPATPGPGPGPDPWPGLTLALARPGSPGLALAWHNTGPGLALACTGLNRLCLVDQTDFRRLSAQIDSVRRDLLIGPGTGSLGPLTSAVMPDLVLNSRTR
jgi:hypothetical protein